MRLKGAIQGVIILSEQSIKTERLYKNGLTTSKAIRMEKGIANDDIFNFDETGFAMGLIATMKVVTRSERFIKGCK